MKFLATLPFPSRAEATLLPALLSVLLVLLAGLQFALPSEVELPQTATRAVAPRLPDHFVTRHVPDSVIISQALFTPTRGGGAKQAGAGPLDGATPVGAVRGRGFARAIIQQASGETVTLNIGQSYHGWRLAGLTQGNATFLRDGKRLAIPFARGGAMQPNNYYQSRQVEER